MVPPSALPLTITKESQAAAEKVAMVEVLPRCTQLHLFFFFLFFKVNTKFTLGH